MVPRCQKQHLLRRIQGLKPWQGHIHVRECFFCHRSIDRREVHYTCSEKCRYDVCETCYKAKRKAPKIAPNDKKETQPPGSGGVSCPGGSGVSVYSGSRCSVEPEPQSEASVVRDRTVPERKAGAKLGNQPMQMMRQASRDFMESSWQRSVEAAFWVALQFAGIYIGVVSLERLTSAKELEFPYPFLTACLSNLLAGLLVIAMHAAMMKLAAGEALSELSHGAEVDWKLSAVLGVLVTLSIGAAVKVLSNFHHTLASSLYMLTPVATVVAASHPRIGMEERLKELVLASAVASLGGMLAIRGPPPSLQGVVPLFWACLAVVFTVGQSLLTQHVMSAPTRPAALGVSKAMLLAGASVGAELSLVYEWSGFWSLPWQPHPRTVFGLLCIIGLCDAVVVVAHTRLIQITSATFASLLLPLGMVILVPLRYRMSPSPADLFGLVLCIASSVTYFKTRKEFPELPVVGYSTLPGK